MDCFEVNFQNQRASSYEIRPASPESIIDELGQMTLRGEIAEERDELQKVGNYKFAQRFPERTQQLIDSALPKLPENVRAAITLEVAPKRKPQLVRLEAKGLDIAVEMLVRRTPSLEEKALQIARVLGTLSVMGDSDNLYRWLKLERLMREVLAGKGVHRSFLGAWDVDQMPWKAPSDEHERRVEERYQELLSEQHLSVEVRLVRDKQGNRRLSLEPRDLLHALVLHAARRIATGTTFNVCEECKGPFLTGSGSGRHRKRADARFCSDQCRWTFNNKRKKRA